jgi:hypothetical protein
MIILTSKSNDCGEVLAPVILNEPVTIPVDEHVKVPSTTAVPLHEIFPRSLLVNISEFCAVILKMKPTPFVFPLRKYVVPMELKLNLAIPSLDRCHWSLTMDNCPVINNLKISVVPLKKVLNLFKLCIILFFQQRKDEYSRYNNSCISSTICICSS